MDLMHKKYTARPPHAAIRVRPDPGVTRTGAETTTDRASTD